MATLDRVNKNEHIKKSPKIQPNPLFVKVHQFYFGQKVAQKFSKNFPKQTITQ
jgi:hypothetical protein